MRKEIMPEADSKIYYKLVDSLNMNQFKDCTISKSRSIFNLNFKKLSVRILCFKFHTCIEVTP